MRHPCYLLAEAPALGRIYECGSCGYIHLHVGPVGITLSKESYLQLVEMVNRSAANYELMLEDKRMRRPIPLPDSDGCHSQEREIQ